MTSDYQSIRDDNQRRYGTDIGRIGRMLMADRYDDRTHFIFELLQNAEDALSRRADWHGSRAVNFTLLPNALRVSHFGKLFDEPDVRGICGIAEGTKDLTAIGHFGIGFKSVYTVTDRPEIHSGEEDFAVESYVWPTGLPHVKRHADETTFILPLRNEVPEAHAEIASGLQRLGPRTLLFLRQIEEISWNVQGGPSGLYLRSEPENLGVNVRRISLLGAGPTQPDAEEVWLVFAAKVTDPEQGAAVGHVEIAFSTKMADESSGPSIQAVTDSPLVVFFPTILQTHLGFLVQGPYRTTPSRDNVGRNDLWNQHLVKETASLLVESLCWLRDHDLLDVNALQCLPLDRMKFTEGSMFAPLFNAVLTSLASESLLPGFGGGHLAASQAKLARGQELRELFTAPQLAGLIGTGDKVAWLSSEITQDRTPDLREYLMNDLDVQELTPETLLLKLDNSFLEAEPDGWIVKLYEFLNGQPALWRRLEELPLIRLEDGAHVAPRADRQLQAFLPGAVETGFPTVRRAVCETEEAREFLQSLGLTEPDPVDDVVWNVLPKYRPNELDVTEADYAADIRRILAAFGTDSKGQREKLLVALRETSWVMAIDAGNGSKRLSRASDLYLSTERLRELFAGVGQVLMVDDGYPCLRGEEIRELLEVCGAARYLEAVGVKPAFTQDERREMRRNAGHEDSSGINDRFEDWSLVGFDLLLDAIPALPLDHAHKKAELLWEALSDVETRRGQSFFTGSYRWTHYGSYSCEYPSAFVRRLAVTSWVPDANGKLQRPEFVAFDTLGWKPNPFLLSKVRFKSPIIETLAKEAGIEPGVLDLLKRYGVTSVADLMKRLGIEEKPEQLSDQGLAASANDAVTNTPGEASMPIATGPKATGRESLGSSDTGSDRAGPNGGPGNGGRRETREDAKIGDLTSERNTSRGRAKGTASSSTGRHFVSYVAAHPDDQESDPDGLSQEARMALEERAIQFILAIEPALTRTPTNNPGFDLFEPGADGEPQRWIEVKAMTSELRNRPVGLSSTQFECARDHGDAFWLYVVEHAGDDTLAHIVRIRNPSGKARTFTFDQGWIGVAEPDEFETSGHNGSRGVDSVP